jgi:hypothetical protein
MRSSANAATHRHVISRGLGRWALACTEAPDGGSVRLRGKGGADRSSRFWKCATSGAHGQRW